jgi:hypothetical protein
MAAVGECEVRAETTNIASDATGTSSFRMGEKHWLEHSPTSSSLARYADIAPSNSTAIALRHPDEVFGSDNDSFA